MATASFVGSPLVITTFLIWQVLQRHLAKVFDAIDVDDDGRIGIDDVKAALKVLDETSRAVDDYR